MEVSYRWLADFLDIEVSREAVEEYSERLTMAGAEVEGIERVKPPTEILVGEVVELSPHPDADDLFLAAVDTGEGRLSTITAAGNLYEGALVPVLPAPGELPDGKKIEARSFRGEKSEGMLCSREELGLEDKSSGIWVLDGGRFSTGQRLIEKLEYDDYILSFEITANRPDLLNVLGIARELSVLTGKTLHSPQPEFSSDREANVEIEIEDPSDTPRYTARTLTEVEICPSPLKIQHRLAKIGLRPKNNVVDATNYVLMEMGHPLHAFDLDRIEGNKITIRRAGEGEELTTLDGERRSLTEENLLIADRSAPIALAGIMGGQSTEVKSGTGNVLLEGACFDRSRIRRSSQVLGLTTDASKRFEKGMDPEATEIAIDRVTELLKEQTTFRAGSKLVDNYPAPRTRKEIELRTGRAESLIGVELETGEIRRILTGLGITVSRKDEDGFLTTPPSNRVDLTREIDLIEEIARIYGYDRIPEVPPQSGKVDFFTSKEEKVTERAKTLLTGLGLYETLSPGFALGTRLAETDELLNLKNPMGEKRSSLRPDVVSSLIRHAERNFKEGLDSLGLFEIGNVFHRSGGQPEERTKLGLLLGGRRYEGVDGKASYDFWDLKGVLEDFFAGLYLPNYRFEQGGPEYLHPGRKSELYLTGERLGYAGELHPDRGESYDLPDRVYIAELSFDRLIAEASFETSYEEPPRFPSSTRDLSLKVPESVPEAEIRKTILSQAKVERAYLYDIYQGDQIEAGKRSLTYEITFRDREKTLSDEEVDRMMEEIRGDLDKKGIALRE